MLFLALLAIKSKLFKHLHIIAMLDVCVVEIKGVEPLTSCLQGRRSSQLSYIPMAYINVLLKSTLKNKQ